MGVEVRSRTVRGVTVSRGCLPFLRFGVLCVFFACALISLSLSGCSAIEDVLGGSVQPKGSSSATPMTAVNASQEGPTPMDTFRALAPPEGMRYTPLFVEQVSDPDARLQRLESAVQLMRNDFDTVVPSMVRLVAVEKDMKELVRQLQTLTDQQPDGFAPFEQTPLPAPEVREMPIAPAPAETPPPVPQKPAAAAPAPAPLPLVAPAQKTTLPAPAAPEQKTTPASPDKQIPGGDAAKDAKTAAPQQAVMQAPSPPVTPEAAPKGELPPEGAASPSSPPPAPEPPKNAVYWSAPNSMAAADMRGRSTQPPSAVPSAPPPVSLVPPAPPAAAAPPPPAKEAPAALQKPPAPKAAFTSAVRSVRVGDHADKTRIVIDLSAGTDFSVMLENKDRTLVVEMPQADWSAVRPYDALSAALVAGWRVEGNRLKLDLMYPASVRSKEIMPPGGTSGTRLVIDLFSKDVHG